MIILYIDNHLMFLLSTGTKPTLKWWGARGGASHYRLGEDFRGPCPLRATPILL